MHSRISGVEVNRGVCFRMDVRKFGGCGTGLIEKHGGTGLFKSVIDTNTPPKYKEL